MKFPDRQTMHAFLRKFPREKPEIHRTAVIIGRVKIGQNVAIGPYSIIGKSGFGYERIDDHYEKINHIAGVTIADNVEIGANTCIDRGKIEDTFIGYGTKIDNLVHVGHNAKIGRHCLIVAGSVIGGSCELGDYVFVGENATIKDHVKVGNNTVIGCGANVVKDVPDNVVVVGNPAKVLRDNK